MAKKKNNTWKWVLGIGLTALIFKDQIKSTLGISGMSNDEDYDRLKMAIDLGLFKPKEQWDIREVSKGAQVVNQLMNRRVGPARHEQLQEVRDAINKGGDWLLDRVGWMLDGSYGSEYYYWIRNYLSNINTKGNKAFRNAVRSFSMVLIQVTILAENSDLNRGQLTKLFKSVNPAMNEKFIDDVIDLVVEKYIDEAEIFDTRR